MKINKKNILVILFLVLFIFSLFLAFTPKINKKEVNYNSSLISSSRSSLVSSGDITNSNSSIISSYSSSTYSFNTKPFESALDPISHSTNTYFNPSQECKDASQKLAFDKIDGKEQDRPTFEKYLECLIDPKDITPAQIIDSN